MNPFEHDLLDFLQMAETPLYSLYRWLEQDLGAELSMSEFFRIVDGLIERDLVELHHVDCETHVGTVVPTVPANLVECYAAIPDLDEHYDPLGFSVALGPAADVRETPDWEIDVDFSGRRFVLTAEPDAVAEGFTQIGRLYDAVSFVETGREVVDSRVRIEGDLADKKAGRDGGDVKRLSCSRRARKRLEAIELFAEMSPDVAVPELRRMLADRRSRVADAAAEALRTRLGAEGHAALVQALACHHERASLTAARSLARERDPRALDTLDAALRGNDLDQWGPAIEGLCCYGMAARGKLERELLDEEGPRFLREMAAGALAQIAGSAAIPALTVATNSSDKVVARVARGQLIGLDEVPPPE